MKKHQDWNNISKEALPPRLKKDEVAVYRLLGIKGDPNKPESFRCPAAVNVPTRDRVIDPKTDEFVDIAFIQSVGIGDAVKFGTIWFRKDSGGIISLTGSSIKNSEMYEYLELSNYNASNPNRSDDVIPIFERLNPRKDAEDKRKTRGTRRQALNIASDMKAQDIRDFCSMMGWDDTRDLIVLRDAVEDYADSNPSEFISKSKNKQNSVAALINRCAAANIITFNTKTNSWKWVGSDEIICNVSRGGAKVEGLISHLVESDGGAEVMKTLQKALK